MTVDSDYIMHRRSDKRLVYAGDQKFWWSDQLKRWICVNPEIIERILKSSEFIVINHQHQKIAERFNIDVSHLSKVAQYLPVTHDGAFHQALRKKFALMIAANSANAISFFEEEFNDQIKSVMNLAQTFDLCQDIIKPIVQKTSLILSGVDWLRIEDIDKFSTIFDETLTVADRIDLNGAIGRVAEQLQYRLNKEESYFRIALFALGNDSLLSTICESLVLMIIKNPDKMLSNFNWDNQIPATGIPVVERVANIDFEVDGYVVTKGQRVRLYLDSAGYAGTVYPIYSSIYFGAGAHTCLGMPIGKKVWTMILKCLARVDKKIELTKLTYRERDNVFNIYDEIKVRTYD